jgi:hypothetical protein
MCARSTSLLFSKYDYAIFLFDLLTTASYIVPSQQTCSLYRPLSNNGWLWDPGPVRGEIQGLDTRHRRRGGFYRLVSKCVHVLILV